MFTIVVDQADLDRIETALHALGERALEDWREARYNPSAVAPTDEEIDAIDALRERVAALGSEGRDAPPCGVERPSHNPARSPSG